MSTVKGTEGVPAWLWRGANWTLGLAAAGIAVLAAMLALGAADPPRAGPLAWQDDFKAGLDRWTIFVGGGGSVTAADGALRVDLGPKTKAGALTPGPPGDFTLEVAGAAARDPAAWYGLVFDWRAADDYSAVLVNGDGYAEAYTQRGAERTTWFAQQQWPHLLAGSESNRVRVDVRRGPGGAEVTVRVNDEVLTQTALAGEAGQVGVLARAAGPAQVVFSWARLWAPRP
jgi:hypothetical protein